MTTIDEILTMLDTENIWLVRAGLNINHAQTLRQALQTAYELSGKGISSRIVLLPDDKVVLEAHHIYDLWTRLGIIKERVS